MIGDCAHTLAYTGSAFTGAIAIGGILLVLVGVGVLVLRKTRSRKKAMLTLGLVAILSLSGLTTIHSPGAFAATTCAPTSNTDPSATTTGAPSTPAGTGQTGTGRTTPTSPVTPAPVTPTPTPTDPATAPADPGGSTEPSTPTGTPTPPATDPPTGSTPTTPPTDPTTPAGPGGSTDPSTPISVNASVTANSSRGTASVSLVNSDDTTPLPAGTRFHLSYTADAILSPGPDLVPGTTTSTITVGTISLSLECTGISPGEVFGPSLSVNVEADCTLLTDLAPGQSATVQITVNPARPACEIWTGPGITITGFPSGYTDSNPDDNQASIPAAIGPCAPEV